MFCAETATHGSPFLLFIHWKGSMLSPTIQHAVRVYTWYSALTAFFATAVFTVIAVYYLRDAGLTPLQLILVGTVLEITVFLFEIPTGIVADLYSRRRSVLIGTALIGCAFVIEGSLPLLWAILLAQIVRGIGETFISGASSAWIADEVGEDRVGAVFLQGARWRQWASLAGIACGALLATKALNLPILLGGFGYLGTALWAWRAMPERNFSPTPREDRATWTQMASTFSSGVQVVRARPVLWSLLSVGLFYGLASEAYDRLWEAHFLGIGLPSVAGLNPVLWFGLINAGLLGLSILTLHVVERRVDTSNFAALARLAVWVNAGAVVVIAAFGLATSFPWALAAFWSAGVLLNVTAPLYNAWLNQGLNPQVRATVLSMSGQVNAMGQMVGGPVLGALATRTSIGVALVGVALIRLPVLWFYWRARQDESLSANVEGGHSKT